MNEPDVSSLPTVQQAMRLLDAVPVQPSIVRVPLARADGLRLAHGLTADRDYPPFDKSQMDGFAVRRDDVLALPADLRLIGEIAAGQWPDQAIAPGETMAIMTGAPMPAGAQGVVPVEDTEKIDGLTIRILKVLGNPARYVAARGSDCTSGQPLLPAGTRMGPAQLAVAASIGAAELDVFAAPRVAVLATGDELVAVDREPGPSQIRNSNSLMIVSVLQRMGCHVTDLGTVRDDQDLIRAALSRGLDFDALFVTGGMSMGEHDYVPRLLLELGVDLKITKLRMKPGKPFVFGMREWREGGDKGTRGHGDKEQEPKAIADETTAGKMKLQAANPPVPLSPSPLVPASSFVFGLPGNPVSAFVCTIRLASRLLTRMAGGAIEERWLTGKIDSGMPVNGPREFAQPALRVVAPGRDSSHGEFATIVPLKWKGSADLFTLARANCLLIRPENDPPLPKGTVLRVLEI